MKALNGWQALSKRSKNVCLCRAVSGARPEEGLAGRVGDYLT